MKKNSADLSAASAEAKRLIIENKVYEPPVPVREMIENLGFSIEEAHFADQLIISGFLDLDKQQVVIQAEDEPCLKALTLARALGHLVLHEEDLFEIPELHILYQPSLGGNLKNFYEKEALYFAVNLLMPPHFLEEDDKETDALLIEKYCVPQEVVDLARKLKGH